MLAVLDDAPLARLPGATVVWSQVEWPARTPLCGAPTDEPLVRFFTPAAPAGVDAAAWEGALAEINAGAQALTQLAPERLRARVRALLPLLCVLVVALTVVGVALLGAHESEVEWHARSDFFTITPGLQPAGAVLLALAFVAACACACVPRVLERALAAREHAAAARLAELVDAALAPLLAPPAGGGGGARVTLLAVEGPAGGLRCGLRLLPAPTEAAALGATEAADRDEDAAEAVLAMLGAQASSGGATAPDAPLAAWYRALLTARANAPPASRAAAAANAPHAPPLTRAHTAALLAALERGGDAIPEAHRALAPWLEARARAADAAAAAAGALAEAAADAAAEAAEGAFLAGGGGWPPGAAATANATTVGGAAVAAAVKPTAPGVDDASCSKLGAVATVTEELDGPNKDLGAAGAAGFDDPV